MKDILQDVVAHTHALGFLSLVKVTRYILRNLYDLVTSNYRL